MKRKKYWNEYATRKISPSKKDEIFSRISLTTAPSPLYQRRSHYVRPVASIVGVAILGVAVFVVGFITDNQPTQTTPLIVQETASVLPSLVQASPVGRIIQTQGILGLDTNGIITPIESIDEGKIITLQNEARIVFSINETVQATITGPARFTIESINEESVLLNLLEGSYAQVKTIEASPEDMKQDNANSEIIVKTKQLEVSTRTTKSINLVIAQTTDNEAVVTNSGDEIIVKNLETQERIAINEDTEAVRDLTTMIANVGQTQVSSLEKNTPLLAIRYEATQDQVDVLQKVVDETNDAPLPSSEESIGVDSEELLALIQDPKDDISNNEEELIVETTTQELPSNGMSEGRVLDQERMQNLEGILNQGSILALTKTYNETEDETVKREALQDLVNTLNQALGIFNSAGSTTASIQNVSLLTQKLLGILEEEYFIPPTLLASARAFLTLNK